MTNVQSIVMNMILISLGLTKKQRQHYRIRLADQSFVFNVPEWWLFRFHLSVGGRIKVR